MTARRGPALLAGMALLVSCDGLGRPVVDMGRARGGSGEECTRLAPRCADGELAPDKVEAGAATGVLSPCALAAADAEDPRIVAVLRDCTLSLGAVSGAEREIVASALDNVRIVLDGAVHLRIADSQLFRVTLHAGFKEGDLLQTLQITHSDVRLSALRADQMEVISSFFARSSLESSELSAIDLQARESLVSGGIATIAAARLHATHVGPCDTLLIAESRLTHSRVDACARVTRLYDVEATACTIDGELESDGSSFADGRFGVREFTQIHGWDTIVDNSVLCEGVDNMRFSAGAFTCVMCSGPLAQPDADVCTASGPGATLESNACAALREPAICESFPRRARPVTGT